MKKPDPTLEKIRSARRKISQEAGNDPSKLIEHYIEYQKQFGDRLQGSVRDEGENHGKAAEQALAPDAP